MKPGRLILACALVVATASGIAGASGATPAKVSGSTALALAGVIAPLSSDLTGAEEGGGDAVRRQRRDSLQEADRGHRR